MQSRPPPILPFLAAAAAAAAVLAFCAPAEAATTAPPAMPTFRATQGGSHVTLFPQQGICVGAARFAEHFDGDTRVVTPGCWVIDAASGTVLVSFLDGERGNIPLANLKPLQEV